MTEKTAEWFLTQGSLGVFALLCLAGLIWAVRQRDNDRKNCEEEKKALHEAHKQELRDNGKALIVLLEKTHAAIDRLFDLEERQRR